MSEQRQREEVVSEAAPASASAAPAASASPASAGLGGISVRALIAIMTVLVIVVTAVFLQCVAQIQETYGHLETASNTYQVCEAAANELSEASAYLTSEVRAYVVTHDPAHMRNYYNEVMTTKRREKAMAAIEENFVNAETHELLERALRNSNGLMAREEYAMLLVADVFGHDMSPYADMIEDTRLAAADQAMTDEEKLALATKMVYDDTYYGFVEIIMGDVAKCKDTLVNDLIDQQENLSDIMRSLLVRQQVITALLLIVLGASIVLLLVFVLQPLHRLIRCVRENKPLPIIGATEMRALSRAYNAMYEETLKNHDALRRKAEHDYLTGLLNRSVFEKLLEVLHAEPYALLLVDADYFKEVNDTLGHDGGDAMLQKISATLSHAFRTSDYACRIGGDEFAVIMSDMTPDLAPVIERKLDDVAAAMTDTSDGLPPMTLSIGIAFNDGTIDADRIYKNADQALYQVKEAGRNGRAFYQG